MTKRRKGGELAQLARDPEAFEAFYREHVDRVLGFVARRVADPYLAADLTADVFLAVIGSAHTYRPERGEPVQWLYGVARNVVAAERRRNGQELAAASRLSGRSLVCADDLEALDARIDAEARARELYEAMGCLDEADRALLELVALESLPVRDAARVLGVRPVAARVRLHRARLRLRDRLAFSQTAAVEPDAFPCTEGGRT